MIEFLFEPSNMNHLLSDQNSALSMFCLNTQGLRAHWDSFKDLINTMHGSSIDEAFDIIGMSNGECNLDGYHPMVFKTRDDTVCSRGDVGIYAKNTYKMTSRTDLSIFIPHILESIFVEIHFNNKSILLGTLYRSSTPPKADMDIFMFTVNELQMTLNREININML